MMFSDLSEENAWRRRSCGVGTRRPGASTGASAAGASGGAGSGARSATPGADASTGGCSPSVSVLRKSAASGPSRMLARLPLPIREHLLRQLAIGVGRRAVGVVLEHRHALDGSLREPNGLPDTSPEDPVAEVLLQDLDRLLGVQGPRIDHRGQDAGDDDVRIEVLLDHGK